MKGGAGNVDHIFATGKDHDSWVQSKPFYGKYRGHTLKQVIRGHNTVTIRGKAHSDKATVTEDGWSRGSTNTTPMKAASTSDIHRYLDQRGTATEDVRCTAHTLRWRIKKRTTDTETRVSRKS